MSTIYKGRLIKKIESGLRSLIQHVPPFEQAWIFFSILISILLLLKKEGSKQAAWLLPLIVLAYAIDNQMTGKIQSLSPDYKLFPSENYIIQHHLDEPFEPTPQAQKEQLEKGWKRYLIHHWSSNQSEVEHQQLEQAKFNFTLARLQLLNSQPLSSWLHTYHEKLSLHSLCLFLLWNSYFAWMFNKTMIKEKLHIQLSN